jgi:hypothetical protein
MIHREPSAWIVTGFLQKQTWWLIVWRETERLYVCSYLEESLWVDCFSFWGRAALQVEALERETPSVERYLLVISKHCCYTDQLTVKLLKERFRWVSVCERGQRSGSCDMKCALKLRWVPPPAMLSITATSLGSISGWRLASRCNNCRGRLDTSWHTTVLPPLYNF